MTEFLDDQFKQLEKIFDSYKEDINVLDDIVRSWEELPSKDINDLSEIITAKIKNKTTVEIYEDEQGRYILDMKFHPISIVWQLENNNIE